MSETAEIVAQHVPFYDLALLCEKVSSTSAKDGKNKLFTSFLEHWRGVHSALHAGGDHTDDSFYLAMRLIVPHLDRQRLAYGMKEVVLAKYYIEVLGIAKESEDAEKLLKYRAPRTAKQDAGDFATVAYYVLKNRCPDKGRLSVAEVNVCLDNLALSNAKKDKGGMKKSLQMLLRNLSALEQNMMMGMSENSVFNAFHPDALDLHNVCTNLEKVCKDLRDPSVRLIDSEITLFSPFRPMLAARTGISQVEKLMDHKPFYVETKFDGDRMQLHKNGDKYMYFSRSGKDYTHSFGATPSEGGFTPAVHNTFSGRVQSCILDGEMVGYDLLNDCFLPKGENVDVKSLDQSDIAHQCFVVFDVLLVNGKNLASVPFGQRIENLPKIFRPIPGRLMISETKEMTSKDDLIAALNDAIDHRDEGLMVKHPNSVYRPDKRKGGWIKIKPEYVDSLSDQLDLIIIGGYYGTGRLRGGMVSHFMCGVAVQADDPADKPSVFHSFCKVGTGYTLNELKQLGQKLQPHWQPFDTRNPPTSIILAPGFKEKPDVWIEPSQSQVVQIKAAEIISSDKFQTGCTLRFPRVERVRDDKPWYDCMDLEQLATARMVGEGRLTHQHMGVDDGESGTPRKKGRVSVRLPRKRVVASQFQPADVSAVTQVSKIFDSLEFCIVNGPTSHSKSDLEKAVAEHGGSFVQSPGQETFCVVAARVTARVKNIISAGVYDVVKAEWLICCLESGHRVRFLPSHMLHTSPATAAQFADDFDAYGDSYTDDVDETELKKIFDLIGSAAESSDVSQVTRCELRDLEEKYFPGPSAQRVFRQLKFYVDRFAILNDATTAIHNSPLDLISLDIQCHGGIVCNTLDEDVSHVICHSSDLSRVRLLMEINHERTVKFHCVSDGWVKECVDLGALRSERTFQVVS